MDERFYFRQLLAGRDFAAGDELAQQIKTDYRKADLEPATRAVLDFAHKLTLTPGRMQSEDVETLRSHGWDDRAIHDIVQVAAYFNYINRLADALGVQLEE